MKRVLCVVFVAALALAGTAAAQGTHDAPASLYDAFGYMNQPTGPISQYAMFTDGIPHATQTPDTTLVHSLEAGGATIVIAIPGYPATANIFTEFFFVGSSPTNPFWEGPAGEEHPFPDNSALVEIHYSMQANNEPDADGPPADGIGLICTLCQDLDAVPGDYEACIPCSNTTPGPNMMRQLTTAVSAGNLLMPSYHGYGIVNAYVPTRLTIDLATFVGAQSTATYNNLILRYPTEQPRVPDALPPTSEDSFRRSR